MSKDEEKSSKKRAPHTGSVAADDVALSTWLHRFWARNEPPEKIELWQMRGRNERGERILNESFKAGEKLDVEQANRLANEMIEVAQHDCDSQPSHARRERTYQIAVVDRNRGSTPLTRALGPLIPKRTYMTPAGGSDSDSDPYDDDSLEGLTIQRLGLAYSKEQFAQIRWEKGRTDQIISELFRWMSERGDRTEKRVDTLLDRIMAFFERLQEAEDRRATRDIMVMKEKLKIELLSDGAKSVKNLLPGLFASAKEDGAAARMLGKVNGAGGNGSNGGSNGKAADEKKDYGPSPERDLVDNFLTDIERAGLDSKLFGEIDDTGEKQTAEGIFSLAQLAILVGVHQGRLPASELDKLMPKSGHKTAITEEQINKAGDAGVTLGMGTALMEIVGLRKRAKELKDAEQVQDAVLVDDENPIVDAPA